MTPAAAGTAIRRRFDDLPAAVRHGVEELLGAPVAAAADQSGGFTHGTAARLALADGRRVFAKAIRSDDGLAGAYRAEAACAAALPPATPAPRLRLDAELAGWLVLVFDDVAGRHPDVTVPAELDALLGAVTRLGRALTPNPLAGAAPAGRELAPLMSGWRRFAAAGPPADLSPWCRRHLDRLAALEEGWAAAVAGDTLLHADLRPDNTLLTAAGEVVVVDWACACVGAAWADLVILLASVPGIDAEAITRSHPLTHDVPAGAIDAFLCALAGCWAYESRQPPLPAAPALRPFQARNAAHTEAWLARRTGWR
ncbi:hypothetical protein Sru01_15720 [Sphaerisporangium rufum]|uniref:Aminoglycoside phosphotransferase domain-containing protein n=1 Tax=Sphaerisporangium rufum TaxID=1381558 RepID=A0A919V3T3_9ACTN|nr:aminoglycoside phosphotransferase family protein [Sphaerisporangium rufum]GII76590.1 hypothetical protein Sru01_15720 [Sphaerisporangium rufum]